MHGFVDEMLIKCWFLVYRKVRGREGNFLFSGKYCVFCIPREKVLRFKKHLISSSILRAIVRAVKIFVEGLTLT